METIEGNKLIAEFMGWIATERDLVFHSNINGKISQSVFSGWIKKEQPYTRGVPLFVVKNNRLQIDYFRDGQLKYHSSWDWLMPVVEKISTWCSENTTKYNEYFWDKNSRITDFLIFRLESKEELWIAVVEFIKWYNKINKK